MADESDGTVTLDEQSPEEQSSQQKFEFLPGELMMMILDYCNIDRSSLKALSVTNRNLCQLCIPLIFRSMSISHLERRCREPIKTSQAILDSLIHLLECDAILVLIR